MRLVTTGLVGALLSFGSMAFGQPTLQDFDADGTGTPYCVKSHVAQGTATTLLPGGPVPAGRFRRLAFRASANTPVPNQNSMAFDRSSSGASTLIFADFDFRLTPAANSTRADGFGFALLRTFRSSQPSVPLFGVAGCVDPEFVAEEPNFQESLGSGFDIHQKDPPDGSPSDDVNNNHLSVHFFGIEQREFPVPIDLAEARWIHARIMLTPGSSTIPGEVIVILTPFGGLPITVIKDPNIEGVGFKIPGFTPYEGRVYFAARSGGLSAEHDLDNINVQFLDASKASLFFSSISYSAVEGPTQAQISVSRSGSLGSTVTVDYDTMDVPPPDPADQNPWVPAIQGTDYNQPSLPRRLTFPPGVISQSFNVTINDDTDSPAPEGDEIFKVILSNPSANAVIGGPSMAGVRIINDESARLVGHWSDQIDWPVVPIHLVLLPTGKVMFWEGSGNDTARFDEIRLWDPMTGTVSTPALPPAGGPPDHSHFWDIFCTGHSFLADGSLFVTGGHAGVNNFGLPNAFIYNPFRNRWLGHPEIPDMNAGRWYPTNTTLSNGDVLVVSGDVQPGLKNALPQVWQALVPLWLNPWRNLSQAAQSPPLGDDLYPRMFLAPDGRVFKAGPDKDTWWLNTGGSGNWTPGPPSLTNLSGCVPKGSMCPRDYGSAVIYDGKVLIVGGGNPPSPSVEFIDLNQANTNWISRAPMAFPRRHHNATLLPDGKVIVTGGTSSPGFNDAAQAVLAAEIYDPVMNIWSTMPSMIRRRVYHSTAVLLPDGRVLSAGGGVPNAEGDVNHMNAEVYSPPYLFKGPRPVISSSPSVVKYGKTFCIGTPNAASNPKVRLIRLGSVTHAFDQNQRLVTLESVPSVCAGSSGTTPLNNLIVTVPANANLVPPGHYMLFIVNQDGVPSVASITQVLGFTDPDLGPAMIIKAIHIMELRNRINAVRVNKCGLEAFSFTDPMLTASATTVRAVHLTEVRNAVNDTEAAVACSKPLTVFTDLPLTQFNTTIKAIHINELRAAVEALELL